jgi:carboxypeptidase Q
VQTIEILRTFKALGYNQNAPSGLCFLPTKKTALRGGNKYAEEAKAKGEKHIFALESDAGGFTPRGFGFTARNDQQFAKASAWKSTSGSLWRLRNKPGRRRCRYWSAGNRTQGTPMAGLSPDSQRYFDIHHARNDVFENVNKRELLIRCCKHGGTGLPGR